MLIGYYPNSGWEQGMVSEVRNELVIGNLSERT